MKDALEIMWSCLADASPPVAELRNMLHRTSRLLVRNTADLDQVRQIVRHGHGDCRKIDEYLAERRKALDEGREPPYEPTGYEVRGAMIAAEAAGKPISEEEAVALLRAHGAREAA